MLKNNIQKVTSEKNEANDGISKLKENIKALNEKILSSNNENNNLLSQMNAIEYQNKKNSKLEQYYENYIKSLNDQIYHLESQIEILQNKVKNISGNNNNLALLREQIIYLQKENQKLSQILKMGESPKNKIDIKTKINNKKIVNNRAQKLNIQSNRSKITSESENEYMKQFINDFHKQIDELNIDSNKLINDEDDNNTLNHKINNIENRYNDNEEYDYYNNNYLNNSNDIIYKGEDDLHYNKDNYKNNEDIKIENETKEINNYDNTLNENEDKNNEMNIDNKIKVKN